MPSWSGLHMSRTTSSGHSSAASNSSSFSSGRRFLAKSLSDFKLNFNVLFVIIGCASLCCDGSHLAYFVGQCRQELQDVIDNAHICHLKYGSFRVLVNSNQQRATLDTSQMLGSSADTARLAARRSTPPPVPGLLHAVILSRLR